MNLYRLSFDINELIWNRGTRKCSNSRTEIGPEVPGVTSPDTEGFEGGAKYCFYPGDLRPVIEPLFRQQRDGGQEQLGIRVVEAEIQLNSNYPRGAKERVRDQAGGKE